MRVDLITSIAIYWYTTVLVPLFYVTNNLDVNILADAALRGIAAQLPRLEVTKYVYPTIGDTPTTDEYVLEPPAYENCESVPLFTYWPSYSVCNIMDLIVLDMELKAAAADSAVNLDLAESDATEAAPMVLGPAKELSVVSSYSNISDASDEHGSLATFADVDLLHSSADELSFVISVILYLLPFWFAAHILTKLFCDYPDRKQESITEALEEQQAEWMWRLVEQDEQLAGYKARIDGVAAAIGEIADERDTFTGVLCSGELLSGRLGARVDEIRLDLFNVTATHIERETVRQGEISSLHALSEDLDVRLTDLHGRLDRRRRDVADMQEATDEQALRVKEQISQSQARLEMVTEGAHCQAVYISSLASALAAAHSEVAGLESSNDALREEASSLHGAAILRERRREDEIRSLRESLLSTQTKAQAATAQEAVVSARVSALQAEWTSAASAACATEESLQAILDDKREQIAALTDATASHAAKTAALVEDYAVLGSAYSEKKTVIAALTSRIASVRDYITQSMADLAAARRTRQDTISALTATNDALSSEHAAALSALESTKADVARVQAKAEADVAASQAALDAVRVEHKKEVTALEAKLRRQQDHLDWMIKGGESAKQKIAALDAERDALEARFAEEESVWTNSREWLEEDQAKHARTLEAAQRRWAEAEERRQAAGAQVAAANKAAEELEAQSKADALRLKTKATMFQLDLGVLRETADRLQATQAGLQAEHSPLAEECRALGDKIAELPAAQDARLEDLAERALATEAARDAKYASRTISSAIRQRTAEVQNAKDTVELLAAASEALEAQLSDAHTRLHAEKEKLEGTARAREEAVKKVRTLRALLATTPTPSLANSSGGFSRSPSLTPPPQTPPPGAVGDVVVSTPGEMDIVESSVTQNVYKY